MASGSVAKNTGQMVSNSDLGAQVARWLRAVYGSNRAKHVGRQFGVSIGTAKWWLSGHAPTPFHLSEMAARWGQTLTLYVFHGVAGPAGDISITALELERAALRRDQAMDCPRYGVGTRADVRLGDDLGQVASGVCARVAVVG